jgi:hypothetical protein
MLEAGGSNVLKTRLVFFAKSITNANNQIIETVELPPAFMTPAMPTNPFLAASGMSMIPELLT